jgi:hypothetical protein
MVLNQVDSRGFTNLMLAAERNDLEAVRQCVGRADPLNCQNQSGDTALAIAVRCGFEEITSFLVDAGADVNLANFDCNTPLILACSGGGTERIVQILVKNRARIQARNTLGETALHLAAYYGHPKSVRILVKNGADVNAPDSQGNRPLHKTSCYAWTDIADFLIAAGADITAANQAGELPLTLAPSFKEHAFLSKTSEEIKELAKNYAVFASSLAKKR